MAKLYTKEWELENIETVLFDKDGTFIDAHKYWGRIIEMRIQAIMKNYTIPKKHFDFLCLSLGYNRKTKKLIKEGPIALLAREEVISSLLIALQKINITGNADTITEIFKEVHIEFQKEIYKYIEPIKEAEILFKRLKEANVQLAVVTSDIHQNAELIVEKLGLSKYFDLIIGKDDCTKAKKTGEPALIAIKKLSADINKTISVGDAPMDYLMAKNSGLKGCILTATGQLAKNDLLEYTKTSVNSLNEVLVK